MVDLRFGHALGFKNHNKIKAKRSSCTSGGFITSPTSGQQVDTSDQVMFAWDSSCLNITAADIYLYAPYKESSLVQMFQNVDFSKGSYNTTLKPKWWNSSSSVDLELTIVETGTLAFLATLPSGPVWTAIYNSSSDTSSSDIGTTSSTDSNVTKVNNLETSKSGLTRGQLAAAVLVPLIVIGLALAAYVKISRKREKSRRKRWSEALDKRMSVISYDWRSMSTRGAEAAIRASMADPGRNSVWSAGAAGVGAHHAVATSTTSGQEGTKVTPEMAQIRRPGVGLRGPLPSTTGEGAGRVSRISFAADTRFSKASAGEGIGARGRPSTDSRRGNVPSRAFHSAYIPPVPSRLSEYVPEVEASNNWDSDENENGSGMMSPTQRAGPLDLSTEDISAHMHSGSIASRPSFDAVQPALNMIRSMNEAQISLPLERVSLDAQQHQRQQQHSLPPLQTSMPTPPPAVKSPIMEAMPMEPLSAVTTMMSPDEMLRAYAERRRTGGMMSPPGSPAPTMSMPIPMTMPVPMTMPIPVPAPVASPVSSTQMRVLYSPAPAYESPLPLTHRTSDSLSADSVTAGSTNPFRKSMATTKSIDTQGADEDAYLGTS